MKIAIIDLESRLSDSVFAAVERTGVDYDVFQYDVKPDELHDYDGIVLTGSHDTVFDGGRLIDRKILEMSKPVLGICYGHQLVHYLYGGEVVRSETPEVDVSVLFKQEKSELFKGLPDTHMVYMYHYDEVVRMAEGFVKMGETDNSFYAASQNTDKKIYTIQFHPEADGNDFGDEIYKNFIDIVCKDKNNTI